MSVKKKRLLKFKTRNKSEALNKVKREIKKRGVKRRASRLRGVEGGEKPPGVRRSQSRDNPIKKTS
nr:MAG TPA_asm: hypothetical protein [Caudoviricetes sp.]